MQDQPKVHVELMLALSLHSTDAPAVNQTYTMHRDLRSVSHAHQLRSILLRRFW